MKRITSQPEHTLCTHRIVGKGEQLRRRHERRRRERHLARLELGGGGLLDLRSRSRGTRSHREQKTQRDGVRERERGEKGDSVKMPEIATSVTDPNSKLGKCNIFVSRHSSIPTRLQRGHGRPACVILRMLCTPRRTLVPLQPMDSHHSTGDECMTMPILSDDTRKSPLTASTPSVTGNRKKRQVRNGKAKEVRK